MAGKKLMRPKADVAGRAVKWGDFSTEGKKQVAGQINDLGRNARANTRSRIEATADIAADPAKSADVRKKARVENETLSAIEPHVRDKSVTLATATNARLKSYSQNIADTYARTGNPTPDGAGWYFNHNRDITKMATKNGFDANAAMTASAVMSPQNSPDNEKAAVGALMNAMTSHKVNYTADLHNRLLSRKKPSDPNHVGRKVGFHELHPAVLADLSSTDLRDHVDTTANLHQISRGGTKENIVKAIQVLRGEVHPDDAIDPHTAPKVWSYRHNTVESKHGTPEHGEYMMRIQHEAAVQAGVEHPGQQMFDHWGLRDSTEGQLSSHGHTAEDTWQNTLTHGQAAKVVGAKGRTAVNKTLASNTSTGYIGDTGAQHAFNNEATSRAAQRLSIHGYAHPSTAAQEVPWTQARREVGKDPDFKGSEIQRPTPTPLQEHLDALHAQSRIAAGKAPRPRPMPTTDKTGKLF